MIEQLTYAQIAERLGVSPEAARVIVKRYRLARSRSNDGNKILVAIDLTDIQHKPMARSPRGHEQEVDPLALLQARVAELEAELARAEQYSRDNRADYERERNRADRIVTAHDRLVDDLQVMRSLEMSALHSLLQAADAQKEQQPVTAQELAAELETFRCLLQRQPVRTVTARPTWSLDWLMPWRPSLAEVAR